MNAYSHLQMVQQNWQEETYEFREPALRREPTVRSEDLSGELQGESEESRPSKPTDDAEGSADVWSMQGDFINRHLNEPRVQLCIPKEETFPIPLKYIDTARSTRASSHAVQEEFPAARKSLRCQRLDMT